MTDRRSDPGDAAADAALTGDSAEVGVSADASTESAEQETGETGVADVDGAAPTDGGAGDDDDDGPEEGAPGLEAAPGESVTFRVRRPAGRRLVAVVSVAAALLVAAGAFAGAMVQPYLIDRATVATKVDIVRTAVSAITTLWTYTPENMDTLPDRAAKYLSGDFEAQYRRYIDAIAARNKQAKITNSTEVTGAGVASLKGSDATAIVYTNTTSTSPLNKDIPSLKYLSYRLVMRRDQSRWVVTRMTTITSLDLTPQI